MLNNNLELMLVPFLGLGKRRLIDELKHVNNTASTNFEQLKIMSDINVLDCLFVNSSINYA